MAAVELTRAADLPIGLATLRITKPGEEGLLLKIIQAEPDAVLVRNLAALDSAEEQAPHLDRIGDFSLNVANELTAELLAAEGLARLTPSYDLNWEQFTASGGASRPRV